MTNWKPPKEDEKFNAADLFGAILFGAFILCIALLPAIIGEFL